MKNNTLSITKAFVLLLLCFFLGSCEDPPPDEENEYQLTINYTGNGSEDPESGTYTDGSVVTLTPSPDPGHW